MGRFSHRTTRLERRRESQILGTLMPLAWLVGIVGAIGMAAIGVDYAIHGRWEEHVFIGSAIVATVPFIVLAYRLVRGHFSSELHDQ